MKPFHHTNIPVAAPLLQNAELWVGTLKFTIATRSVAISFIAPVFAVEFSVAPQ